MGKTVVSTALAALLSAPVALAAETEADHDRWFFGAGFRVGGVFFNVGYPAYGYHPGHYYFRTSHRIRHRGYACGTYCFKQKKHYYHHASCPLVGYYFRDRGYAPHYLYDRYGPRPYPPYGRYYRRGW